MPTNVVWLWSQIETLFQSFYQSLETLFDSGYQFTEALDADEGIGDDQVVGSGAVQIKGIFGYNTSETEYWLKIYDSVKDDVTVGVTESKMSLPIPPSDAGFIIPPSPFGTPFDTACCFAVVDDRGHDASGGPGDNEVYVGVWFD